MLNNNNTHQTKLGIVLSGGAGRRLGGLDKGLQPYLGKPLIKWVLDSIAPQVDQIVICVNRNEEKYRSFGYPVVCDDDPNFEGPMAGLVAALKAADLETRLGVVAANSDKSHPFDYFQLASCDAPHIPRDLVSTLHSSLLESQTQVAVPHDGERRQNLHCLISSQMKNSLIDFYQGGGRALHRWFETIHHCEADFSEHAQAFQNLNTLEQIHSR